MLGPSAPIRVVHIVSGQVLMLAVLKVDAACGKRAGVLAGYGRFVGEFRVIAIVAGLPSVAVRVVVEPHHVNADGTALAPAATDSNGETARGIQALGEGLHR